MPRKNSEGARVATAEDTTLRLDPLVPVTLEERQELRRIFASLAFKKALKNCRRYRPKTDLPLSLMGGTQGGQLALMRYHEMKGWDDFERWLAAQADDPKPAAAKPAEEFKVPA